MKPLTFMLIVVLFILLACGGGDGGGSTATPQLVATPVQNNWPSEWEGPLPTVVVHPK